MHTSTSPDPPETHTWGSGVDGHGAADQADVQTVFLVDQAGDGGLVRGEELLQADFLGPLAALIHNDAEQDRTGDKNRAKLNIICFFDNTQLYLLLIHYTVAVDVIRDIAFRHYFMSVYNFFPRKSIKFN